MPDVYVPRDADDRVSVGHYALIAGDVATAGRASRHALNMALKLDADYTAGRPELDERPLDSITPSLALCAKCRQTYLELSVGCPARGATRTASGVRGFRSRDAR